MTEAAIDRRAAAKHTTEMVHDQELERAGRVATQRIRDRVHDIPSERRHLVTIGDSRVEVIETAAVEDAVTSW
jgi:NifU-like N terminal domain